MTKGNQTFRGQMLLAINSIRVKYLFDQMQLQKMAMSFLLSKPYVNETSLTEQNLFQRYC